MSAKIFFKLLVVFVLVCPLHARSLLETPTTLVPYKKQYIELLSENDAYVYPVDRYYTAGNRVGYVSKEYNFWGAAYHKSWMAWSRYVSLLYKSPKMTRFSISVTQSIYTPLLKNRLYNGVVPHDHLYAGWLRADVGIFQRSAHTLESIFLSFGTVGPNAFAEQIQDWVHNMRGDAKFLGWSHQIRNEFIFEFSYQWLRKVPLLTTRFFSIDMIPGADITLGNAITHFRLGSMLRMGYNLDADFGPNKINSNFSGGFPYSNKLSIYVFVGASGTYQPIDVFVQGNSPETRNVTYLPPALYAVEGGIALLYKGFRVAFIATNLSKTFRDQPQSHNIGTAEVSLAF
ncbi:lipid A deacylase LpxR family protein [Helicobacter baculiformis]|uniref:Lipid A deacylase LpxR family protein n=1 Tax=Helicobacter baculiformis TaxID=427351 RepID=A0ABV7ZGM4_9HELI|nr:lipid A deacylase LpxR family protein [Helicobacter baculiformis]